MLLSGALHSPSKASQWIQRLQILSSLNCLNTLTPPFQTASRFTDVGSCAWLGVVAAWLRRLNKEGVNTQTGLFFHSRNSATRKPEEQLDIL